MLNETRIDYYLERGENQKKLLKAKGLKSVSQSAANFSSIMTFHEASINFFLINSITKGRPILTAGIYQCPYWYQSNTC